MDRFWRAGTQAGYADDGPPGPRPQYREDYYGAFLRDPDGNSAEAVHHGALRRGGIIDHLWIRVADVPAARRFYETIAPSAGLRLGHVAPDHAQFAGASGSFSLVRGTPTEHLHMAFATEDDADVQRFHTAATEAGYRSNGPPGSVRGITAGTTPPTSSIPTATTSRSSTTTGTNARTVSGDSDVARALKRRIGSAPTVEDAIRLSEVLGALSLTTDLGAGVPFEKGLRTCVVASQLADALELGMRDRQAAYFAALLRSLGCTAHASVFAEMFDDDVAVQRELKTLDLDDPEVLAAADRAVCRPGPGPSGRRSSPTRFVTEVPAQGAALGRGSCEVSAALGARLELPAGAIAALDEVYERYDGNGFPAGRGGDELTIAARVVHVAEQAVMAALRGRAGGDGAGTSRGAPAATSTLTSARAFACEARADPRRAGGAGHARRCAGRRAAAGADRARRATSIVSARRSRASPT